MIAEAITGSLPSSLGGRHGTFVASEAPSAPLALLEPARRAPSDSDLKPSPAMLL